ncbi:hypothetical protein LHJ74_05760 [Streptomyces sp. N2-109]|uniref:Uncharacterized protein n=1 Tax=Streptomyces gossypii TaxID=2883101 RepID=A0ABT2JNI4_9ACTN|nr:hypothetical protein [Streptomyces gossypii]MCT2589440.1 hypothetical protein [Streptomyces gossypii]
MATATSGVPRGLCVRRVPSKPVRRQADGRYALHLWLQRDGKFDCDLALHLSPAEAEALHAQLCFALDGEPPIPPTPDSGTSPAPACRKPVQEPNQGLMDSRGP